MCHGFVCPMCLWHFLVILIYLLMTCLTSEDMHYVYNGGEENTDIWILYLAYRSVPVVLPSIVLYPS